MKKILYVEDNLDTAEAVKIILSNERFDVFTANNGKQCFETIKKNSFDLFLLDVMLPDISGWEIFKKLKEGKQKDSKFVFLSAIPVSKDRHDELTRAGISDYITKPFKKNDLIKKVKLILEQS